MSVMSEILEEQYPYTVDVLVTDGLTFHKTRTAIIRWCLENIYEYDVVMRYDQNKNAIGYTIRCSKMDDCLLAKLKWA